MDLVTTAGSLSEKESRRLFRQLVSAVDHIHMANVVHRDLKLENVLLDKNRNILVTDFGLGRTFEEDIKMRVCYFNPDVLWHAQLCST
jgi:serine/threonine protein kinase